MEKRNGTPVTIDQYLAPFPAPIKKLLGQVRATIKKAAPDAAEVISYQMPGYKLDGMLVWFAGCKNHVGFYPSTSGVTAFKKELSAFDGAKGSVQFPYDKPLPLALIREIVKFRVLENREKAKIKKLPKLPVSAKTKKPKTGEVEAWMSKLDAAGKKNINSIRMIIRKAAPGIGERIKWNAPSYYYKEKDFLTFGPYKGGKILLVFHHPGIVKIKSALLEGNYKDRRLLYFNDPGEIKKHKDELTRIIRDNLERIG